MKYLFALLLLLLGAFLFLGGFKAPDGPRVIVDGPRFQVLEDPRTNMVCVIDKTGKRPPECHRNDPPQPESPYYPNYPDQNIRPDNPDL